MSRLEMSSFTHPAEDNCVLRDGLPHVQKVLYAHDIEHEDRLIVTQVFHWSHEPVVDGFTSDVLGEQGLEEQLGQKYHAQRYLEEVQLDDTIKEGYRKGVKRVLGPIFNLFGANVPEIIASQPREKKQIEADQQSVVNAYMMKRFEGRNPA